MIRVPAGLFALWCSCCCFPVKIKDLWMGSFSAIQIAATSGTNLQDGFLEHVSCSEYGQCVSQDIIFPKYFFQLIVLPKYHFAKVLFCQNITLANYVDAKSFSHISLGRCLHWLIAVKLLVTLLQHLRIILRGFLHVTSQGRWFHWNHHYL